MLRSPNIHEDLCRCDRVLLCELDDCGMVEAFRSNKRTPALLIQIDRGKETLFVSMDVQAEVRTGGM